MSAEPFTRSIESPPKQSASPLRLLALVVASVFVAEAAVMLLFTILPPFPPLLLVLLDACLLIILAFPALYLYLLRPLSREIDERRRVEAALQQAHAELEARVQERTEELTIANVELQDEIDERQRVEAQLRESEERFRLALKNAPVSAAAQDRDLRFRWAYNQRTVDPSAVIGKTDSDVFPPEDAARLIALKRQVLETETETREQFWLSSGGQRVFIDLYLEPMRDASGHVTGIGIATVDLTQMKLAEEALRESEERLRALYLSMTEGLANYEIVYRDGEAVDYLITDVNPAFERITGLVRSAAVGRKASELYDTGGPPYLEVFARVASGGAPAHFETYFAPMDKHFVVSVFSPEKGKFATVFTDITERKQAEEQMRLQTTALQAAANAIVIAGPDGAIQWVNAAFTRMTGYNAAEVIGQNPRVLKSGQHDLAFYQAMWGTILDGRVWRGEIVNKRKDGSFYTEDMTITPVADADGEITHFIAIKQDITARKQAEEKLAQHHAMLQAVIESADGPIFSVDGGLRYTSFNVRHAEVMKSLFGADIEIGRPILDYHTNPTDRMAAGQNLNRGLHGESFTVESLVGEDIRTRRYFEIAHNPVRDALNAVIGVAVYARDITDRKKKEDELGRLNRMLRALSDSSQAMTRAQDEAQYLAAVCQVVVEDCGHAMVWIGFAEEDEARSVRPVASAGFEAGYLDTLQITWADTERGRGPTGTAIRTHKPSGCRNMLTDPNFAPWRAEAIGRGYASSMVIPLLTNDSVLGVINIYSKEPDSFSDDEVNLLTELADDLVYGITAIRLRAANARAEEALRRAHNELELRVKERTQALAQANEVLRAEIAERKRIEGQLRVQTTAMEAAANGILITDPVGTVEWCNPALTRMTGYAAADLIGQTPRIFQSGQHPQDFYQQLWSTILSGRTWRGEIVNRRQDGSHYTEEQTITPVLDETGVITHFIAIKQDITDRKRADNVIRLNAARTEALAEVSRALMEASLDYQTILDALAHGAGRMVNGLCVIHLLSEDGQSLHLATIYHTDPDTVRYLKQILGVELHRMAESWFAQVVNTGQPLLISTVLPEQLRHELGLKDGWQIERFAVASLAIAPLRMYSKLVGTIAVGRDQPGAPLTTDDQLALQRLADRAALAIDNAQMYTNLQHALQQEQDIRRQLVQAETFAAMGRIVAAVAHELNNPLQTIGNCLFLIQQEIQPEAPTQEYFQMAAVEFERLTNLVAQLRALQRSRIPTPMQPLNLRTLLDEVHLLLQPKLRAHVVQWQWSSELPSCDVVGNVDQLKQVCLNISLNALEAMQHNGGILRVGLIASADSGQVGMRFQDTGPGIAPENLAKVFEPLFTTKSSGLGLGLPICYEIVHQHNGRITVESEPGQGATFTVWLLVAASS